MYPPVIKARRAPLPRLLFMALEEEARGLQWRKGAEEDGGLAERMQQLFGGRLVNYIEVHIAE